MSFSTVSEQVYEFLKKKILSHELPPGTYLQEQDLAAELGISRTPLREAITRLGQEGLVTLRSRRSAYVTKLGMQEIIEILEVREALECQSVRLATQKATPEDIKQLRAVIDDRERELQSGDGSVPSFDLHEYLVRLSGNRKLLEFMNNIHNQLSILRLSSSMTSGRSKDVLQEHRQIVEAIAAGDADLAEARMRAHLTRARENIIKAVVG